MNQQITINEDIERANEIFSTLPEDEQAAMCILVNALATWEEPQKGTLLKFMEWTTEQEASRKTRHEYLMGIALACAGNELAYRVMKATIEKQ